MNEWFRYLRSDFYKLWRSPFMILHIGFPVCGAGSMAFYALFSKSNEVSKLAAFFQILAIVFPFAIGIACQIVTEQEAKAGNFQNVLTLPHRIQSILSKLSLLLLFGWLSAIIAAVLSGVFFSLTGVTHALSFEVIVWIPTIIWGSNLWVYGFQYLAALRFGGNFCIAAGAVGSLLSALLQTGLGTDIWFLIPYGFGVRFSEFALKRALGLTAVMDSEIKMGVLFCSLATSVIMGVVVFWFSRYEGN